jgi:hypothetical protein
MVYDDFIASADAAAIDTREMILIVRIATVTVTMVASVRTNAASTAVTKPGTLAW